MRQYPTRRNTVSQQTNFSQLAGLIVCTDQLRHGISSHRMMHVATVANETTGRVHTISANAHASEPFFWPQNAQPRYDNNAPCCLKRVDQLNRRSRCRP